MRRLSWYWMMKYSWLCCSLRRSFSVSWVNRRSSSKAWLICWYFWDMLSIMPTTGELDCQLQSEIERQVQRNSGSGRFGNSKRLVLHWMVLGLYIVIELFMIVVKGNGWTLVSWELSYQGYPWGLEQRYETKLDLMHWPPACGSWVIWL